MVELDGQEYVIQTPQENAFQAIQWVNQYCIDNNIRNLAGEIAHIEAAPGSPLYLIFLAFAYLATLTQNLIYGLGRMLNIGTASNRQLISLGEIVRMRRKEATYTTIRALVYASPEAEVPVEITREIVASIQVGSQRVGFSPLFTASIPPGSVAVILLQASVLGSFFIPAGTITGFDSPLAGMESIDTEASQPGRPPESYDQFRRRLQLRDTALSSVEKCVQALRELPGIQAANITFNYSNIAHQIQGYNVEPRMAIGFIQGYNDHIAETIFSYLMCDMMPLSINQSIELNNGQILTAYWDTPIMVPLYIDVYCKGNLTVAQINNVITAVQSLALNTDIASAVTTADILRIIQSSVPDVTVTGATISIQDSEQYRVQLVQARSNELFEFNRNNIRVLT